MREMINIAIERFRKNLPDYMKWHKNAFICLLIAGVLDAGSTIYFMKIIGSSEETHPMFRLLAGSLGIWPGVILSKIIQIFTGLLIIIWYGKYWCLLTWTPAILYTLAAFYNMNYIYQL